MTGNPPVARSTGRAPEGSEQLRASLLAALEAGGQAVERLGSAGTSITIRVVGAPDRSVTILLDRNPPELADASAPAEITIELSPEQAAEFARGELAVPARVLSGEIPYSGPIRKYLTFDPVLRAQLARLHESPG